MTQVPQTAIAVGHLLSHFEKRCEQERQGALATLAEVCPQLARLGADRVVMTRAVSRA
jgi:F0F1-type ATP synthase membrane subunit b/b'